MHFPGARCLPGSLLLLPRVLPSLPPAKSRGALLLGREQTCCEARGLSACKGKALVSRSTHGRACAPQTGRPTDGSFGAVVLGGFSTQPLMPELPCGEGRLLLIQLRARKAVRMPAAREGGRQGWQHPGWNGGTHSRGAGHGVWEPGKGAGRCCLPAPSAGMRLAALPAHGAAQHVPGNPGSPGDPRTPECPEQGWGATQGLTLAFFQLSGQAGQGWCGSAQGKGWSAPYGRPRWEHVLTPSRAPAAPQH